MFIIQIKKDEIKDLIENAAMREFAEKGFKGTKVSDIALRANVSVGNVYRYFQNKQEIFYTVAPPSFAEEIKIFLRNKIIENSIHSTKPNPMKTFFHDDFIQFILRNRDKFLIVMNEDEGTEFSGFKKEMVQMLTSTLKQHFTSQHEDAEIIHFMSSIYENLINLNIQAIKDHKDEEQLKERLLLINQYHLFGVSGLVQRKKKSEGDGKQ